MKSYTILAGMAILMLMAAVTFGQEQPSALEMRLWTPVRSSMEREKLIAEEQDKHQKDLKSGRDLFGIDKRWNTSEFVGTLLKKQPPDFKVGDWGCISGSFKVFDKVSKTECLVTIRYDVYTEPRNSKPMLLKGLDMSKVVDGVEFILQHPVAIQDTYTYSAVSGNNKTVLVLECNSAKLKEIDAELKAKDDAEQQAAIEQAKAKKEREAAKWRNWTDSTGKYTTYAKYGGIAFDKVTLIKQDGSKVQLPLDKLSDEDREWVANRSKHLSSPQDNSHNSSQSK
ncbi:MAG: SHD1 domain-containing protein [Thermoguttaceae bacterium]|jgi:hypothetical protein